MSGRKSVRPHTKRKQGRASRIESVRVYSNTYAPITRTKLNRYW